VRRVPRGGQRPDWIHPPGLVRIWSPKHDSLHKWRTVNPPMAPARYSSLYSSKNKVVPQLHRSTQVFSMTKLARTYNVSELTQGLTKGSSATSAIHPLSVARTEPLIVAGSAAG
jgi:hypothetical protein